MASENEMLSSPAIGEKQPDQTAGTMASIDLKEIKKNKPKDFESWSGPKKQAWNSIDVNPNAFFYRHKMPGEEIKKGPWTDSEKAHFLQILKEHPPTNGHWGTFSTHIPERVGYQCNSFYKKLIQSGEILDPNQNSSLQLTPVERSIENAIDLIALQKANEPQIQQPLQPSQPSQQPLQQQPVQQTQQQQTQQQQVQIQQNNKQNQSVTENNVSFPPNFSCFNDLALLVERPPKYKYVEKTIDYHGDNFAYKYNIINEIKDEEVYNPEVYSETTFRDTLVENLKNPENLLHFRKEIGSYFKFV